MPLIKRKPKLPIGEEFSREVGPRTVYVQRCPRHLFNLISPSDAFPGDPVAVCPLRSCGYRVEPWHPLTRKNDPGLTPGGIEA
jgi:hypothetical protein